MKHRQLRKREFTIGGITVRSHRYRSAVRIARGVQRGEMTPDGRTIRREERKK